MQEPSYVHRGTSRDKQLAARQLRKEMTLAERRLWTRIRKCQCSGAYFRRQQPLCGFIVDFYCAQYRLAVEVDGEVHLYRVQEDESRSEVLLSAGITVLRFKNEEVLQNVNEVAKRIDEWLRLAAEGPA